MQLTFGDAEEMGKRKRTRREIFLNDISSRWRRGTAERLSGLDLVLQLMSEIISERDRVVAGWQRAEGAGSLDG